MSSIIEFKSASTKEAFESNKAVLKPNHLWEWFFWLTEIARPSGSLDLVRRALKDVGARLPNVTVKEDSAGNICLSRPATPGHEGQPGLVFQCHMDMVVAHDAAARPAFAAQRDGIEAEVRSDGWVYARGTSLGADDGIGVATCLALLCDPALAAAGHPAIDCLFTADEETTMGGAEGLDPAILTPGARYLVNVDSEDDSMLCLGSAGGGDIAVRFTPQREPLDTAAEALLSVALSGFAGGHTGVEIDKYRANAVKQLANLLSQAQHNINSNNNNNNNNINCNGLSNGNKINNKFLRIAEFSGGVYTNALPNDARALVAVPRGVMDAFVEALKRGFENLKADYRSVESADALAISVEAVGAEKSAGVVALDTRMSSKVLSFWALAPSSPIRMSPDVPGLVETSCAFTIAKVPQAAGAVCEFDALARTSRETSWDDLECMARALADVVDGEVEISGRFPGWLPEPASRIAKAAEAAHAEALGKPCVVYAVHAGLECGLISQKVPGMEAISIGPKVEFPHTVNERCNIETVTTYYDWVMKIIEHLSK